MEDRIVPAAEEIAVTLRRTNDRLRELVGQTMTRVLDGSADRESMEEAYAALRGEIGAAAGVDALRRALAADGMDTPTISHIEALYMNALMGV
jgi:hypothetical protein